MRIFTYKVWQKMFFRGKEGHHLSIKCKKLKNKNGRCHFFATKIEMHTFIFCHKNNDAKKNFIHSPRKQYSTEWLGSIEHCSVQCYLPFGLVELKNYKLRIYHKFLTYFQNQVSERFDQTPNFLNLY